MTICPAKDEKHGHAFLLSPDWVGIRVCRSRGMILGRAGTSSGDLTLVDSFRQPQTNACRVPVPVNFQVDRDQSKEGWPIREKGRLPETK